MQGGQGEQDWAGGETELHAGLTKSPPAGQAVVGHVLHVRAFCFRPKWLCFSCSLTASRLPPEWRDHGCDSSLWLKQTWRELTDGSYPDGDSPQPGQIVLP